MKMFNANKTRAIGLPYGEKKLWQYVKPFSSNPGTPRTDRQTDRRTGGKTELLYQCCIDSRDREKKDASEVAKTKSAVYLVLCVLKSNMRRILGSFCGNRTHP